METMEKTAMHITSRCLVVPIQAELADELVLQIQSDVLEKVNQAGVKGVIIDVSGVNIIDTFLGREIFDTARMAFMLGATTVITGLKPGVATSLVDLDFEHGDVQTALTIEAGLNILRPLVEPQTTEEEQGPDYDEEQVEVAVSEDAEDETIEEQEDEPDEDEDCPDDEDDLLEEEPADEQ